MFKRPLVYVFFSILSFLTLPSFASVGTILLATGEVNIQRAEQTLRAETGAELLEQDKVITRPGARAQLRFSDDTVITLGGNTEFGIESFLNEDATRAEAQFSVAKGTFKAITGRIGQAAPENFTLKTRTATIGIRGTIFSGRIREDREIISTQRGRIAVTEDITGLTVEVPAGQITEVIPGQPPRPPRRITPQDMQELEEEDEAVEEEASEETTENDGLVDEDMEPTTEDESTNETATIETRFLDDALDATAQQNLESEVSELELDVFGWIVPMGFMEPEGEHQGEPGYYLEPSTFRITSEDLIGSFDNYVGWGEWNHKAMTYPEDMEVPQYWVGGIENNEALAYILKNPSQDYNYTGTVIGSAFNSNDIANLTGSFNLAFDFEGDGMVSGSMSLNSDLLNQPANFTLDGDLNYSGFYGYGWTSDETGNISFNGTFYGPEADSVGGAFVGKVVQPVYEPEADPEYVNVYGVFKGTR